MPELILQWMKVMKCLGNAEDSRTSRWKSGETSYWTGIFANQLELDTRIFWGGTCISPMDPMGMGTGWLQKRMPVGSKVLLHHMMTTWLVRNWFAWKTCGAKCVYSCLEQVTCGNKTFSAHRGTLAARSDVFFTAFGSSFAEARTAKYDIKNSSPDAVEAMLYYMYTGHLKVKQATWVPEESCLDGSFTCFLIFIPIWGNDPIWPIFLRWVETTN